jgi:hypothetical protein
VTAALDAGQRTRLERIVSRARRLLEHDLADQAAGRFGIDPDGTMADEDALRLDSTGLTQRREVVEVVDHLKSEGDVPPAAVARLLRETTFTHLNRLLAIRIAEALGLLPPSLANGRSSQGFRDLLELAPLLAGDHTGGYWTYLKLCGDELAGDVPALFDPRNPLLVLAPSPGALDDIVELLAEPEAESLWLAPDCLGWTYQFFNTGHERRAMREGSAAPRDSRELAVRNQFFTPRYVVDFLVQNSLGRRLMDADPTSSLLDDLPLLIDPPSEAGEPVDLEDVSMLDPACGSGHFLLAAYDVLERAWHHAGVDAAEAAPSIVRSLWGVDIDARCVQVAAAAVIFRARRSCPDGELPRPNIICARAVPATATGLDDVLTAFPINHRELVEAITEAMTDAPILGSLLKIEDHVATEVRAATFGGQGLEGTLVDALPEGALEGLEEELLGALGSVANATTAAAAERLLAAEADDAIRFVHALQRRHDAVCMNPPFGEPVAETKAYLNAAYPWISTRTHDLFCAFVGRGVELAKPDGYVGAITPRAGFFLQSYERWRDEVVLASSKLVVADLGLGVMEQALVEACAYVVTPPRRAGCDQAAGTGVFIRLLRELDRASSIFDAAESAGNGEEDSRIYRVRLDSFNNFPGHRLAYWAGDEVGALFSQLPAVEGQGRLVRRGLQTGDDFRFLRLAWEVRPENIVVDPEDQRPEHRWAWLAKGGEYSPFASDVFILADWKDSGQAIMSFDRSIVPSRQHYFRPGVTWPRRTASGFGPRTLPASVIFSDKGPGVLVPSDDPAFALGWLNTRLVQALIDLMVAAGEEASSGGASRSYETGIVEQLPWPDEIAPQTEARIASLATRCAEVVGIGDQGDETTRRFVRPAVLEHLAGATCFREAVVAVEQRRLHRIGEILRSSFEIDALALDAVRAVAEVAPFVDEQVGRHPVAYPENECTPSVLTGLYAGSMDALVDQLIGERGGSRAIANLTFVADRRVEVISHGLQTSALSIVEQIRDLRLLPPHAVEQAAADLVSYLVGIAFGRWDARVGYGAEHVAQALQPFDPVPVLAPGALFDSENAHFESPGDGILVDQAGHHLDLDNRILKAAREILSTHEPVIGEVLATLGRRTSREYLRKAFFKAHLSKYSKSRRKAPIYWPLYVPSGAWGVWVYAPQLSRETLFAVGRAAADRLDHAEAEIRRLQRERDNGGAGRSAREVVDALEGEEELAEELRRFRDEAQRIARLGWEPDLDDGIILCAAPLANVFPAWKDALSARKDIKAGKYPWATVSKWADQL